MQTERKHSPERALAGAILFSLGIGLFSTLFHQYFELGVFYLGLIAGLLISGGLYFLLAEAMRK